MAVELHEKAYQYAQKLIGQGDYVFDELDDWSEHQPTTYTENQFIEEHGIKEYGKWHLGVDNTHAPNAKSHYKFPYGDFSKVHRCAVIAAEIRAAQNDYFEIVTAAAHLHGLIDGKK
jgi:hypothetical protein